MRRLHLVIAASVVVLVACGRPAASIESIGPAANTRASLPVPLPSLAPATTTAPTSTTYPTTPEAVVREFLTSLQIDPSGTQGQQYVGGTLAQSVTAGRSLPAALGVQNLYDSFDVPFAAHGVGASSTTVNATLQFQSGPIARAFTLTYAEGTWRITTIAPPTPSSSHSSPATADPLHQLILTTPSPPTL